MVLFIHFSSLNSSIRFHPIILSVDCTYFCNRVNSLLTFKVHCFNLIFLLFLNVKLEFGTRFSLNILRISDILNTVVPELGSFIIFKINSLNYCV